MFAVSPLARVPRINIRAPTKSREAGCVSVCECMNMKPDLEKKQQRVFCRGRCLFYKPSQAQSCCVRSSERAFVCGECLLCTTLASAPALYRRAASHSLRTRTRARTHHTRTQMRSHTCLRRFAKWIGAEAPHCLCRRHPRPLQTRCC